MRNRVLKQLKVLLVEDEENIARLLKDAIGDSFFSCIIATDGEDGLEKFEKHSPDIVITDINMPRLNGLDMSKKLKDMNPTIPIIILSAFSEKEKLFSAIDIGVTKYFLKPFDPDELLDYIDSISENIASKMLTLSEGFVFNKGTGSLYKNDRYVSLSKKESAFFSLLLENVNKVIDSEQIKSYLWAGEDVSDERVRTFIRRVRAKTSKKLIKNVKGIGYQANLTNVNSIYNV